MTPHEKAMKLAMAISEGLNCLGLIASPRPWERYRETVEGNAFEELRGHLRRIVALGPDVRAMSAATSMPFSGERLVDGLSELLTLIEDADDVTPPIQAKAREVLAATGLPEPPGGWDAFEGPDAGG